MKFNKIFAAILTVVLLSWLQGCSADQATPLTNADNAAKTGQQTIALNPAQTELYQSSLKQILPNPATARFTGVKALKFADQSGIHICGYVKNNNENGEAAETPFYIELRMENDQDIVHRGQVGSDPAKLAKVKFVCRHHQDS